MPEMVPVPEFQPQAERDFTAATGWGRIMRVSIVRPDGEVREAWGFTDDQLNDGSRVQLVTALGPGAFAWTTDRAPS